MNRWLLILLLAIILIITFLLSSKMILNGDFLFLADQARDFLLTKDVIQNKPFILIGTHSGLGGFFHGPLWIYMLTPFYILGNGDPFTFTYFYILISLSTVILGFFAGFKLYGPRVGIFIAFLLALSPSIWAYVPNTIGVNMVPMVFIAMFYFLVKYIRGERYSYIFAVFFAGLSLQFETALPLMVLPIIVVTFFMHKKSINDIKLIVLSLLSFCISILTFILFELRHNFLMARSLMGFISGGERQQGYMSLLERFNSHLWSLESVYRSVVFDDGLLLPVLAVAIVVISIFLSNRLKDKYFKEWIYLILFPVFVMILYMFYPYPVWPEYLLGLIVPVVFAFAISMSYVADSKKTRVVIALFVLISIFYVVSYLQRPFVENSTSGSYLNQKNVAEWIYEDSKGEEFGYFFYSPNTYTYAMDYLLSYLGENEYGFIPESRKHENTYLIMYPPIQGDLNAHDFWKENVLNIESRPSARQEFRGGIIVEKFDLSNDTEEVDSNYYQNLIFR